MRDDEAPHSTRWPVEEAREMPHANPEHGDGNDVADALNQRHSRRGSAGPRHDNGKECRHRTQMAYRWSPFLAIARRAGSLDRVTWPLRPKLAPPCRAAWRATGIWQ